MKRLSLDFRAVRIPPGAVRLLAFGIGTALLLWGAASARRAGLATRAELRQTERTADMLESWRARFRPATPAESLLWQRRRLEVQDLGVAGDERLALARRISRAAESAGLSDVRVLVVEADTTDFATRLSHEGMERRIAPFGLAVEFRGNLQGVVAFIGELPLSVAPTQIGLVRQDGRSRHRMSLAVFELDLINGTTAIGTSLERGDRDRLGGAGTGG